MLSELDLDRLLEVEPELVADLLHDTKKNRPLTRKLLRRPKLTVHPRQGGRTEMLVIIRDRGKRIIEALLSLALTAMPWVTDDPPDAIQAEETIGDVDPEEPPDEDPPRRQLAAPEVNVEFY